MYYITYNYIYYPYLKMICNFYTFKFNQMLNIFIFENKNNLNY